MEIMGTDLFIGLWMMAGSDPRMTYNINADIQGYDLVMQQPLNDLNITQGTSVTFTASATDAVQTDISSQIQWYSSIDGLLGTGASVTSIPSRGNHVIRAQISNLYGVAIVQQSQRLTVTGGQFPSLAIISPREGVSQRLTGHPT